MIAAFKTIPLFFVFILPALADGSMENGEVFIGKRKNFFTVDEIRVEGLRKVEPEAILEKVAVRKGMVVDNYLIRGDIRRIYGMKHFETVEVHHKRHGKKDILIFRVREKPIISKIAIEGNVEVDEGEIKEQLKTKRFSLLDINSLKNDVALLQKFYEDKGFFLATVNFEVKKTSKQQAEVFFHIKEFDKVKVKKITFLGNEKFSDEELRALMVTREESLFSGMSGSGNFKEFDFKTDLERIKYFYKVKGHLQVNMASPAITVSKDKKWIFITIKIVEGPTYRINEIFFNGEMLFPEEELREKLILKPDSLYAEDKLRDDIRMLTELYQDEGYAFANVLRDLDIVPGESKVNLRFSFEKGNLTSIGKISVKGNTKTRDKVIRRELKIHEGMKYSGSKLRESKENVARLGFFEPGSVVFNTIPSESDSNVLDVEIQLKERNTGQLSIGGGYSTTSGAYFQGSVAQNNFRGLGQHLRLSIQNSQDVRTFQLGFTEPYFNDTQWSAGIDLYNDKNETGEDQLVKNRGLTFRFGLPVFEYTRLFAAYKILDTNVSNVDDPTIDEDVENGVASIIDLTLVRDSRDNRFEPSKGSYVSISGEYAGLGFEKKWTKLELDTRYYHRIVGDLVARHHLAIGQLFRVDDQPIPRSAKFFLGGGRNMRGYETRKVGPQCYLVPQGDSGQGECTRQRPESNRPIRSFAQGGMASLFTTFELEYPLVREARMKAVVFVDAGNVYEEEFRSQDGNFLRYDYGFGMRWFSPLGVLRFEFAYPLEKKPWEKSSVFFFDIGQLF
ncbi:MAG: outer membrane protein assembly factor BamA [Bacteriovoracales bacterium]|nr:outer membrane protein assembly factor BamA [Bacteriovoracales bacterium]